MTARGKLIQTMSLEHQLNLARNHFRQGNNVECLEDILHAILMAAGGAPSIYNARKAIREAFAEDPDWRRTYIDNIACKIMDFEKQRFAEPNATVGPMTVHQRDYLADQILDLIFGE